jgi:hypothetical protein
VVVGDIDGDDNIDSGLLPADGGTNWCILGRVRFLGLSLAFCFGIEKLFAAPSRFIDIGALRDVSVASRTGAVSKDWSHRMEALEDGEKSGLGIVPADQTQKAKSLVHLALKNACRDSPFRTLAPIKFNSLQNRTK